MYKRALHSFFLKVHPDFFAKNVQWQRTNESSIAQLNGLLTWAKDFKGGALRPPPSLTLSLTFHRKPEEAESAGASQLVVRSTFELPPNFLPVEANKSVAERCVNKFLRDLLKRAGCMDSALDAVSAAQDVTATEKRHTSRRPGAPKQHIRTLMDEAQEAMEEKWSPGQVPTVDDLVSRDQILFSNELSPLQCAAALKTLTTELPRMQYDRWYLMPLIVSHQFGVGAVSGSLSVPWDFTAEQFLLYYSQHEAEIAESRSKLENFASLVETLIGELCQQLRLDDVLISCSHAEALECLKLLHANVPLLNRHNVTDVTIEIGDMWGFRANGVVIINKAATRATLEQQAAKLGRKMGILQETYQAAKRMLESTEWHLKRFREAVHPAAVDPYSENAGGASYAERLSWAKELYRAAPRLAQWDWSEYTFVMGPVRVDWEGRNVMLPCNFDGDAFIRYIEKVQKDVKLKQREKYAEYEQMRKAHDEKNAMQQSVEELEAGTDAPSAVSTQHPKKTTVPAPPYADEYLSSSASGDDHLKMERPLIQPVTFESEQEADEQLKWEGFYQSPYAAIQPIADQDDVAHTLLKTNRWHKEEAVKRIVEELQERYGKSKFPQIKLGDVLKVNDPRTEASRFPTVAKGTYVPDNGSTA